MPRLHRSGNRQTGRRCHHRRHPGPVLLLVMHLGGQHAIAVEILEEAREEVAKFGLHPLGHFVQRGLRHAVGIIVGLEHIGNDGADQHRRAHALALVTRHVARDLAATHGKADQSDIVARADLLHHIGEIVGEGIVIVALGRMIGMAETAPVIGDRTIAVFGQLHHDRIPAIGRKRPAMDQDHGAAFAKFLVAQARSITSDEVGHSSSP